MSLPLSASILHLQNGGKAYKVSSIIYANYAVAGRTGKPYLHILNPETKKVHSD